MKIAIIGAGVSGLACAHEFERLGIRPVIYEKNNYIGEAIEHCIAVIDIFYRPIKDPLKYIQNEFGINIAPINTIKKIIHFSPNNKMTIKGKFGSFASKGKGSNSIKNQLFSQLKNTVIKFNEFVDYEKIKNDYDRVIVATGNSEAAQNLGLWRQTFQAYTKGATVYGRFEPGAMLVWINKDYCRDGYAYFLPYSNKMATLALVVNNVEKKDMDYFWNAFLAGENLNYTFSDDFIIEHKSGQVYPRIYENIYLVGNAGGGLDPLLGFGLMSALITGAMAARSIACNLDYEKLIDIIARRNTWTLDIRKRFNRLDNKAYDKMLSILKLPAVKQLAYKTEMNILKHITHFLKGSG